MGRATTAFRSPVARRSAALATGRFEPLSIAISDRVSALCLHSLGDHEAAELLAWRVHHLQWCASRPAVPQRGALRRVDAHPVGTDPLVARGVPRRMDDAGGGAGALRSTHTSSRVARCWAPRRFPMAMWRGDAALAARWVSGAAGLVGTPGAWPTGWRMPRTFGHVMTGEADRAWQRGGPRDGTATARRSGTSSPPSTPARPSPKRRGLGSIEGAVGWCAPEVMRLVALAEIS